MALLPKLTYLSLHGQEDCTTTLDMTALSRCSHLTALTVQNWPYLSDVTPLAMCTSVLTLMMRDLQSLTSIEPLSALTELKVLYIKKSAVAGVA